MRPLNKKYFGNRNVGSASTTADNKIGGEGIASYGTIVAGSGWTTNPDPYFSDPTLPGGVTVTGTVHYKALSFSTTANGSGYDFGDVVEVNTGTATTKARATVAEIITSNIELANPGADYEAGNTITMSGAGWSSNLVITVTGVNGGGAITTFTVSNGRRTAAVPANPVSGTTATGAGSDDNGAGATFTLTWGVYSFSAPTVAGDYTGFPSTGGAGALVSVSPATGTGAKADITMGLLSVVVTEKGSGYVDAADALLQFDEGANGASAVAVLTTDSGAAGSLTNQENAIVIYANVGGEGGTLVGDIIKQVNDRAYKIKTADGTKQKCNLVADSSPAEGEAYIKATDNNGNTYFVTKLSGHTATLVWWSNNESDWLFANGARAKWTLSGDIDNDQVTIENA